MFNLDFAYNFANLPLFIFKITITSCRWQILSTLMKLKLQQRKRHKRLLLKPKALWIIQRDPISGRIYWKISMRCTKLRSLILLEKEREAVSRYYFWLLSRNSCFKCAVIYSGTIGSTTLTASMPLLAHICVVLRQTSLAHINDFYCFSAIISSSLAYLVLGKINYKLKNYEILSQRVQGSFHTHNDLRFFSP